MSRSRAWPTLGLVVLMSAGCVTLAHGRADEAMLQEFRAAYPELFTPAGERRATPYAVPDIFGPGAVLDVGNIHMKVTNFAVIGNPFPGLSSDPSAQWPGPSGIEYLSFILLGVGGVNNTATDPAAIRRVSLQNEWRPQTLDPEDRMYRSYDGQVNGIRLADDDLDSRRADPLDASLFLDEDFQDGRDNDGDGAIDEDFAALGQKMWSCVMWDNTPQALATTFNERHVPLNLECRQTAWAYSVPGFQDFNVINWQIFNRSGHGIDSMYVGVRWDMDAGPFDNPVFFNDDLDIPFFPHGDFTVNLGDGSKWAEKLDPKGNRRQLPHADMAEVPASMPLCPSVRLRVNGFSVVDNEGDEGRTPGIPSILLLGHTIDPNGEMAPEHVGWHGFRSFIAGTPYGSGGNPGTDAQRTEMFQSTSGINPETGFIDVVPVDQEGDIQGWAMVGPFGRTKNGTAHPIPDGGSFEVTFAFAVQRGTNAIVNQFPADYDRYLGGTLTAADLFSKYPALENAFAAQVAYEGVYDVPPSDLADDAHINTPTFHGQETRLRAPEGFILSASDCRDEGGGRSYNEFGYTWFDFDCDWCTGVWKVDGAQGLYLRRWNTAAPPPNPNMNVAINYNFSSNPDRNVVASGDRQITLAWDNLSEVTVDSEKGHFDFRSYRIWKSANWQRPVGSSGPSDADWSLLAHFRFFDFPNLDSNRERFSDAAMAARHFFQPAIDSVHAGTAICPQVVVPNLTLQTVVLAKSRFGTASSAADWVRTHESVLGQPARYDINRDLSEDGTTWRFNQADGQCRLGSFHSVGLDDAVWAEACINPVAEYRGFIVPICLYKGDLWDQQTGEVLRPTPSTCPQRAPDGTCLVDTIPCIKEGGQCKEEVGKILETNISTSRIAYGVGRYKYVDREVKNGFMYFYSVTAGDSSSAGTGQNTRDDELVARRSAVEAEGVVPQEGTHDRKDVWVVPNPYRGYAELGRRPSGWDLTPNATDPTGTHIDFLGLPGGRWTISIYTVSGDLVQTLRSTDEVNEALRGTAIVRNPNYNPSLPEDPVLNPSTITVPGFNRQQDNPNDGQARWNLISRNGQDIVSGVYMFVVESDLGTQRGKFVVIR
jgi:hypothetical protein